MRPIAPIPIGAAIVLVTCTLCSVSLGPRHTSAQAPGNEIRRIGLLADRESPRVAALREGLRELGWIEGWNLVIESRFVQGRDELLPALTSELVRLGADILLTASVTYIEPAQRATETIPIVFCTHYGPVEAGHVDSLRYPGGNVTGLANPGPEMTAKRLEILKEALPAARRIAVLWPRQTAAQAVLEPVEAAARALGVELRSVQARNSNELDDALATMVSAGIDALLVPPSALAHREPARLSALALKHRLPGMFGAREIVEAGGLMSYAVDLNDQFRRCAGYADKILRGAKPAELPVEQASKYQLVINFKTAQALGLELPPRLLARADEVIE